MALHPDAIAKTHWVNSTAMAFKDATEGMKYSTGLFRHEEK
jgi:hypothetical protein